MSVTTLTVKIKKTKTFLNWFIEQSKKAAQLYNSCLNMQMIKICNGENKLSAFDLAKEFQNFELGSDYKDRIYERVADSVAKWVKSEHFRYQIYWQHKEKNQFKIDEHKNTNNLFLTKINQQILHRNNYRKHVQRLSRKQLLHGRPRQRKTCSLAFSIRKNRQETIQIKRNKIEIGIPKFKQKISGRPNFLPTTKDHQFVLVTLKKDTCGTCWFKITLEEKMKPLETKPITKSEKIVVGIDMGLKTTRTAVAVNMDTHEIVDVYQPIRVRYFDKGYKALVWASHKDKRHLPFVHRKIARRRIDNIGKDITKILSMGDEYKFGKPSAAFLFSGRLARSAADAANSMFVTRFAKRAELAEKKSGEVDESYTSVTCRKCLNKKPMPLKIRIYECEVCSHIEDRDMNSGYQIAFRHFTEEIVKVTKKIKSKNNGQLSGREMKFEKGIFQRDFQAQPPCKQPDLFGCLQGG